MCVCVCFFKAPSRHRKKNCLILYIYILHYTMKGCFPFVLPASCTATSPRAADQQARNKNGLLKSYQLSLLGHFFLVFRYHRTKLTHQSCLPVFPPSLEQPNCLLAAAVLQHFWTRGCLFVSWRETEARWLSTEPSF